MVFKKIQRGLTLIEVMSSLAVLAVVIGGALSLYSSASASQTTNQTLNDISALRLSLKSLYYNQSNFPYMNFNALLIASKGVPNSLMGNPNVLTSAWGGSVAVQGYGGRNIDIYLYDTPLDQCVNLLSMSDKSWFIKRIGGGGTYYFNTMQVTPDIARTACQADTSKLVLFTFLL